MALAKAQVELENDPNSRDTQSKLRDAESAMKTFREEQVSWMLEAAQIKWDQENGIRPTYICASFKQQAVQKDIAKLQDEDGNVKTAWTDLANIANTLFTKLLGTLTVPDEEALQQVLRAHTEKIFEEAKEVMENDIFEGTLNSGFPC